MKIPGRLQKHIDCVPLLGYRVGMAVEKFGTGQQLHQGEGLPKISILRKLLEGVRQGL